MEITFSELPKTATRFEWRTTGDRIQGLFLGIAADSAYPGNYLGIVQDWVHGLVFFSLPLHLRKLLYKEGNIFHGEVVIEYLGLTGRRKSFSVSWF